MADSRKQAPAPVVTEKSDMTKEGDNAVVAMPNANDPSKKKVDAEAAASPAKLSNYLRIISYGATFDWFLMGLCTFMAVVSGAAMPLMFLVFGRLVNNFTAYFIPGSGVTREQFQHSVNRNSLYMVYIFVGRFVSSYISMFAIRISGLRISGRLRSAYLEALFNQPVSEIDKISPGKVSTRITTSSNTIQLGISQAFVTLVQAVALTVGLYVVSFIKSWSLTLVASVCLPFVLIVYSFTLPVYIKIRKRSEDLLEEASALSYEIFSSIRIVVAFGAEERLHGRHDVIVQKSKKNELKAGPHMGLLMAPMFFSTYATFALAFWFGIHEYQKGRVDSVGSITVVLFSIVAAVGSLGRIWSPIMSMTRAASASTELFATIDADVPDTRGRKDVPVDADIRLENVYFAYPSRDDVQILHGVNARFEAGKTTAIVGPSGSGKSTIVGLVERWYDLSVKDTPVDPKKAAKRKAEADKLKKIEAAKEKVAEKKKQKELKRAKKNGKVPSENISERSELSIELKPKGKISGRVMVGDVDLSDVDAKWWRSQIGLVQQEPFLFNATIHQNVAYGLCGTEWATVSDEEKRAMVIAACKEAYADEFVTKLPEGYDSMVGESGIKLSGGQRQRIAIARSIVKRPSILILDEATSAIDVRTERIVQRALDRVSKNRTTIVIAHRLSTIKKADKIIVLRKGNVIEEGTHDQLLQVEDGVYHGLVHAQKLAMEKEETADEDFLDMDIADPDAHKETDANSEKGKTLSVKGKIETPWVNKTVFTSFGRMIYEQRTHYILYTIIISAAIGAAVVYPLQSWIFAKVINAFTLTGDELVKTGNFWALMFFILAIGVGIAYFILGWAAHAISLNIFAYYRSDYLKDILSKRIVFFDQEGNSAGTLTSVVSNDPQQLQQLLGTEMSMALISIFNLIGCMIISFVYGWKLSLVGVLAVLPVILLAGYWRIKLEMNFSRLNAAVFAESSQFGTEAIGAFRTVTSMIMEDVIHKRYDDLLKLHVSKALKEAIPSTIVFATSDSIDMLCQALVFWYGGRLMASLEYNVVQFFVIYMAVIQGSQAAGTWFSFAPNIAEATAAANRILQMRPTADEQREQVAKPFNPSGGSEKGDSNSSSSSPTEKAHGGIGIEFRNVSFTYKSRNVPVLTGLDLKIEPGQFAALVGASGCGKSTTISLLERFYDPTSGQIIVGDQDITTVDPKSYRSFCSLVAQESTLYEGTIRENVALSVDDAAATDEAIHRACGDAQIHEFIVSLPEGYDTKLGPKGVQLSGGQRQRLALARALLREPKILLLDEATSSLDSESEKLVQGAIERAAERGERTIISVAHRLATVQKADIIFVMGSGKVLEKGNHEELLKLRGVYYQMCQAQALDR